MNLFDSPCTLPAPSPLTSVHPQETTDAPEPASTLPETPEPRYAFRHASWKFYRTLTLDALTRLSRQGRISPVRSERFADCGRTAWILRHNQHPDRYKVVLDCCHDRFCVPCGRTRAHVVAENLTRKLAPAPHRLLTLTLRHSDTPLHRQLTRLFLSFKRLRSRTFWRERVTGGAAVLELTFNSATRLWHPHLHVILQGSYLPQPSLRALWLDITGDSSIVDIKLIRDAPGVVSYITKYITKPLPPPLYNDPDTLESAIVALTNRKTVFTFGTWVRWHLLDPHDSSDWTLYSHVAALPYALPDAEALNDRILACYHAWYDGTGPPEFTIRGPPQREFDDPFDA